MRLDDVVSGWQSRGQPSLDHPAFRRTLRKACGDALQASDAELDALFDRFDADSGGTLDAVEMAAALARLRDASREAEQELLRLQRERDAMWKSARASQVPYLEMRGAQQREHAAGEAGPT